MSSLTHHAVISIRNIAITFTALTVLTWINGFLFHRFEQSEGINWVFLPAGIRLLATLFFGLSGFVGLLIASIYLNFHYFAFQDDARALYGAVAASGGPYLGYLFAKHWFDLRPRLGNLTAGRLFFTGMLCGLMGPILYHAFSWVHTGLVDWPALMAMITGDVLGILIILFSVKSLIKLTDPADVDPHLR